MQIGCMKKEANMQAVKAELEARNVNFDNDAKWRTLLQLLKDDEKVRHPGRYDKRFFKPLTAYDSFKWRSWHFEGPFQQEG